MRLIFLVLRDLPFEWDKQHKQKGMQVRYRQPKKLRSPHAICHPKRRRRRE